MRLYFGTAMVAMVQLESLDDRPIRGREVSPAVLTGRAKEYRATNCASRVTD